MTGLIEFETDRLRLRQWKDSDLVPFSAMNADPRVMEFFPATLDGSASDALADKARSLISERGWGFWAMEVKGGASFIGFCGLHIPSAPLPFMPCVEIGWRLSADHWRHGYATEAALGALQIGFERLQLPEIVSFAVADNHRSRRVMERIGMTYSERFEHPDLPERSPLRPHVLYRKSLSAHRRMIGSDA